MPPIHLGLLFYYTNPEWPIAFDSCWAPRGQHQSAGWHRQLEAPLLARVITRIIYLFGQQGAPMARQVTGNGQARLARHSRCHCFMGGKEVVTSWDGRAPYSHTNFSCLYWEMDPDHCQLQGLVWSRYKTGAIYHGEVKGPACLGPSQYKGAPLLSMWVIFQEGISKARAILKRAGPGLSHVWRNMGEWLALLFGQDIATGLQPFSPGCCWVKTL